MSEHSDGLPSRLFDLINAGWTTRAIAVAAELRLAEALQAGPRGAEEVASDLAVHAASLYRLLRALCAIGLVEQLDDGTFALTPLGALLRTEHPHSLRGWALQFGRQLWPAWGELSTSVRTGTGLRERQGEDHGFAHLQRDEEAAATFNQAMRDITRIVAADVADKVDLSNAQTLVDVGGGHGQLLMTLLRKWPHARGVSLDLAHAQPGAVRHFEAEGVGDRAAFITGDFFVEVPRADVLLLKAVLHDWDDRHCARILRNCRGALDATGRLLVIDRVLPDRLRDEPRHRSLARSDLTMLVGVGGRERTESELFSLLQQGGFSPLWVQPLVLDLSLIGCNTC